MRGVVDPPPQSRLFLLFFVSLDDGPQHGQGILSHFILTRCHHFLFSLVSAFSIRNMSGRNHHQSVGESDPLSADTCTQPGPPQPQWRKRPAAEDYVDKDDNKRVDRRAETLKVNGNSDLSPSANPPIISDGDPFTTTSATNVNTWPESGVSVTR